MIPCLHSLLSISVAPSFCTLSTPFNLYIISLDSVISKNSIKCDLSTPSRIYSTKFLRVFLWSLLQYWSVRYIRTCVINKSNETPFFLQRFDLNSNPKSFVFTLHSFLAAKISRLGLWPTRTGFLIQLRSSRMHPDVNRDLQDLENAPDNVAIIRG